MPRAESERFPPAERARAPVRAGAREAAAVRPEHGVHPGVPAGFHRQTAGRRHKRVQAVALGDRVLYSERAGERPERDAQRRVQKGGRAENERNIQTGV